MEIPQKIYLKLRPLILPIDKIVSYIPKRANILDLGCGKGLLTHHINNFDDYTGVDLNANPKNSKDNIKFIKDDCLTYLQKDLSKHNTFLLIDLIHHIPVRNQFTFLGSLIDILKPGDKLIIKDIYPRNDLFKFWNSFHDLVVSKQIINYLDFDKFEKKISHKVSIMENFHSRIFLYDHYFLILEKN